MAVVHVPPRRRAGGGGIGTVRRLVGIALLVIAAGAAAFIWWGKLKPDRQLEVGTYVQRVREGATTLDPTEAEARAKMLAVERNAGAAMDTDVELGDIRGGDGRASHHVIVSNDVGDRIVLRVLYEGAAKCRVLGVEGNVQADPNADLKKREGGATIKPPGLRPR